MKIWVRAVLLASLAVCGFGVVWAQSAPAAFPGAQTDAPALPAEMFYEGNCVGDRAAPAYGGAVEWGVYRSTKLLALTLPETKAKVAAAPATRRRR